MYALNAGFLPVEFTVGRSSKERVHARGICTESFHHFNFSIRSSHHVHGFVPASFGNNSRKRGYGMYQCRYRTDRTHVMQ